MSNPLSHYFRAAKYWVPLPSGTEFYPKEVVDFNDNDEIGIFPMTAKDEITLKNPDALLNGEAIVEVIKSCVPAVKDPKKLIVNDIDALLIAIRHASYGEELDIDVECPSCKKSNKFGLTFAQTMGNISRLEKDYSVDINKDVSIHVKPFDYSLLVKALKTQFNQFKAAKELGDSAKNDEEKIYIFSKNFQEISKMNFELVVQSVKKVVANETEVTDQDHIREFIYQLDNTTFKAIDDLISKINKIGTTKEYDAECVHCKHVWKAGVNFNPVNFFTAS